MKMIIFPFENEIQFNDSNINVLEVANKKLFANIVNDMNNKINNIPTSEKIILLDNDAEINFSKEVVFILDIFNIDFNQKKMQDKLYKKINDDLIKNYENYEYIEQVFQNIREKLMDIIAEYSLNIIPTKNIEISDCLKALNIRVDTSNLVMPMEKIIALIDIVEMFDLCKLIIFVNLKTYLDDDQIVEIYKYSKYKKVNILLIEQKESITNLRYEKKLFIDEDFCDIII